MWPSVTGSLCVTAPFTPFTYSNTVNLSAVPALAAHAKAFGVNTIWTVGGMGQFETLSMNERKNLTERWTIEGAFRARLIGTYARQNNLHLFVCAFKVTSWACT